MSHGWRGAVKHGGYWVGGGLISWRRNLKTYPKIYRPSIPWRGKSMSCHYLPGGGRRIQPLEYREIGDAYARGVSYVAWKFKSRHMVLGRGEHCHEGGPVGREYRI